MSQPLDSTDLKFQRLRQLAEQLIDEEKLKQDRSGSEINTLLHELHVHQVELSLQNDELLRIQNELEEAKQKFTDLFDYAPLAYFVIDEDASIIQANLTGVTKFATTRKALQNTPFAYLVASHEQDKLFKFHRQLVKQGKADTIEVWFNNGLIKPFYGKVDALIFETPNAKRSFRIAITDITERKLYEDRLEIVHRLDQRILSRASIDKVVSSFIGDLWLATHFDYIAVVLFQPQNDQIRYFARDNNDPSLDATEQTSALGPYKPILAWTNDNIRKLESPNFLPVAIVRRYPNHLVAPIMQDETIKGFIDIGVKQADDFDKVPSGFVKQLALQISVVLQQSEFIEQIQKYASDLQATVQQRTEQLHHSQQAQHAQRLFTKGIRKLAEQINQSLNLNELLESVLSNLRTVIAFDVAHIIVFATKNEPIVERQGKLKLINVDTHTDSIVNTPIRSEMSDKRAPILLTENAHQRLSHDQSISDDIQSYIGIPIQSEDKLLGFIEVYARVPNAFTKTDLSHISAFAEHVSIAINTAQLKTKGQHLVALEEGQRHARDLHDAVTQMLFALGIMAEALPNAIAKQKYDRATDIANAMKTTTTSAYAEMRLLLLELQHIKFDRIELYELFHQLTVALQGRNTQLSIQVFAEKTPPLSIEVKKVVYRITQEALNNVVKHAQADHVIVRLWVVDGMLNMIVDDNGQGFDVHALTDGEGIRLMRDYAERIGAKLNIHSQSDTGTRIHLACAVSS